MKKITLPLAGCDFHWFEKNRIFPPVVSVISINESKTMFVKQEKPKDFDCGRNLDLMIAALPRIEDHEERMKYTKRAVGLIKQSHPGWLNEDEGAAWEHFKKLAEYDPADYDITNPDEQ